MSSSLTPTRQVKPNFSGKWRLVPDANTPAAPAPLIPQADLTIRQTTDTLTTEQPGGIGSTGVVTMTYKLDGSETRQTVNRAEVVTKAWWDGETLVTTVTGQAADWKDTWRFVGARLVIATTAGRTVMGTRTYERM